MADRLRAGPSAADGVCASRGEDVRLILRKEFGLVRSLSAVYHLLHASGSSPSAPGPASRRRRPRPRRRSKKVPRPGRRGRGRCTGERVEVWFEDEARFGQKGTLTTVWAERENRPTAPKQGAFGNLHVLTAV